MNRKLRTPLIYLIILVAIILMATGLDPAGSSPETLEYSQFLAAVKEGKVAAVQITVRELVGLYKAVSYTHLQLPVQEEKGFFQRVWDWIINLFNG